MRRFNNNKMRAQRVLMKYTQEELASITNLSVFTISRIESGAAENLRLETLYSIAKALLLDPEDLLMEDSDEKGGEQN